MKYPIAFIAIVAFGYAIVAAEDKGNSAVIIAAAEPSMRYSSADAEGRYRYWVIFDGAAAIQRTGGDRSGPRAGFSAESFNQAIAAIQAEQTAKIDSISRGLRRTIQPSHYFMTSRNAIGVRLTVEEANWVRSLPNVAAVERERIYPLNTWFAPEFTGADQVWSGAAVPNGTGLQGEGMVVAILDTGVNLDHPSFANMAACGHGVDGTPDKLISAVDCSSTDVQGRCNGPDAEDRIGHGSFVASIAVGNVLTWQADPPPFVFVEYPMSGIAPCAHLRSYKVCPDAGCPGFAVFAGMGNVLLDGDVDAMNFSLSSGTDPWRDFDRTKLDLVAADIFVAASAGNRGGLPTAVGQVRHRGPWVMTVAASTRDSPFQTSPLGDVLADFSLRGPTPAPFADLQKPDITAPGVGIYAAFRDPEQYATDRGTSLSSPMVAGAAALVSQARPDWSPMEVKSAIQMTAVRSGTKEDRTTPWDWDDVGSGRVDLTRAALAGLVMDESMANFIAADPALGGDVRTLNLPSLRDMNCQNECSWTRTLTSTLLAESHWTVSTSGDGFEVEVQPSSFTMPSAVPPGMVFIGGFEAEPTPPPTNFPSQTLTITVRDVPPGPIRFGAIHLIEDAGQAPAAHLTVAVQR